MRTYIQYSYGGYNIYRVDENSEALTKEVDSENSYDFPQEAFPFFQNQGCKIACWRIQDGSIGLVVKGIPCLSNSDLKSDVLFVADTTETEKVTNLINKIVYSIDGFYEFFSKLFDESHGLKFNNSLLKEYIESENQYGNIVTLDLTDNVFLFLPNSKKFAKEPSITDKIMKDFFPQLASYGFSRVTIDSENQYIAYSIHQASKGCGKKNERTTEIVLEELLSIVPEENRETVKKKFKNMQNWCLENKKILIIVFLVSFLIIIFSINNQQSDKPNNQDIDSIRFEKVK